MTVIRSEISNMTDILIVDDQDVVRAGIIKMLGDNGIEFDEIYEASDGEEAILIAKENNPEIILVDVVMPKVDGLQFINNLRNNEINSKIIIISAYGDFNFAKKAIDFKVDDYLLKPVSSRELLRSISKVRDENLQKQQIQGEHTVSHYSAALYGYLSGDDAGIDIHNVLIGMGIERFHFPFYKIALIKCDYLASEQQSSIKGIIDEHLSSLNFRFISFDNGGSRIVYIVNTESMDDKKCSEAFLAIIKEKEMKVNCGISNTSDSIDSFKELYRQANISLRQSVFKGVKVFTFSEMLKTSSQCITMKEYITLLDYFRNEKKNDFNKLIHDIFVRLVKEMVSVNNIENILLNLVSFIYTNLSGMSSEAFNGEDFIERLKNTGNIYGMKALVESTLDTFYTQYQEQNRKHSENYIVNSIIVYCNNNYSKDISLTRIANELSMNYSYVSTVFTKKYGMSFPKYLTNLRLNKAIELLKAGGVKINDVALSCGFKNSWYFCKIFKKYFDITPGKYMSKRKI